jgi:AraC-like DNA-binding protein
MRAVWVIRLILSCCLILNTILYMREFNNQHFEVWGDDLEMPLIQDCGYNDWQVAERLSWHAHDGYELVLLLDGQAAFEFADGSRCELAGGQFFFKLPGQVHRAANDVTSPCKMLWIVFKPDESGATDKTPFTAADLSYLRERYCADERKIFTFTPAINPLLHNFRQATLRLHSDYRRSNPPDGEGRRDRRSSSLFTLAPPPQVALMRLYICQLLLETARQAMTGPPKKADDFVAAAIAYMEENYRDSIGIDEVAGHLGLSRSYLHTVFRQGTGQTPNDYLQRTRIKAAEAMLCESQSNVTEIASHLGFSSSQYFSKVFHKYTRQTPQEYRRSKAEDAA